jgi:hypothetical protein
MSCLWALDPFVGEDSSDDDEDEEIVAIVLKRRRERRARAAAACAKRQKSGPQSPKRRLLSNFSWEDHLHRLSPEDFKLRYRLDLASFEHLHSLIQADLETKNVKQVTTNIECK